MSKIGYGFISLESKVIFKDYRIDGSSTPLKLLFVPLRITDVDMLLKQANLQEGDLVEVIIKRRSLPLVNLLTGRKAEESKVDKDEVHGTA